MTKIKILLLNSLYIYGGGEYFTFSLAKYLNNNKYDVYVSCPPDTILEKKCIEENIPLFCLNYPLSGKSKVVSIANKLKNFIKENKIDIVHSNTNFDRTAGAFATIGTKAVHTASIHSFYSIRRNLTHLIRNKYYVKHFIASGDSIKKLLVEKDKIPSERITSIRLGIDTYDFNNNNVFRKKVRERYGLKDNELVIGNVGRLVKFKGQEKLIKAFSEINKKYPDTKLIITGDGELKKNLAELCAELSVQDKVIFTGFQEKLNEIYPAFDIYVHPSLKGHEELFPFAVLNALAACLPVIASDTGELKQMVKNNVNGYLLETGSPELISEKLDILINDKEKRKKFGQEGLELVNEKFTLEKMGQKVTGIYKKII